MDTTQGGGLWAQPGCRAGHRISLPLSVATLASETLPLLAVTFITDNSLVAAVRKPRGQRLGTALVGPSYMSGT